MLVMMSSALATPTEVVTPRETIIAEVTAYSSEIRQTDSTPNITASGTSTRDGIIANNEYPFGTRVMVDGKIYEVQDRMHPKNNGLWDIWFPTRQEAIIFGRQFKEIEILND